MEVDTPVLGRSGATDPHLNHVLCRLAAAAGTDWYLQASPEYFMKRLLAAGGPDIYQICRVFRDTELGALHQPEFTMIEWYRREFTLQGMWQETCELLSAVAGPPLAAAEIRCMSYREIFTSTTGLDPLNASTQDLASRGRDLLTGQLSDALCAELTQDRSALLDLLMSHVVLPGLGDQGLLVIVNYPAEQAALARLHPDEPDVAERFEVFYRGVELANGYRELRDAAEQAARFERDRLRRRHNGKPDMRPDPSLLAALEHGLPDCCGVALGFDRVVMLALGLADIAEATSFALQDPI